MEKDFVRLPSGAMVRLSAVTSIHPNRNPEAFVGGELMRLALGDVLPLMRLLGIEPTEEDEARFVDRK